MKLDGFLTDNDVNTINLTKGNIVLKYDSSEVGDHKVTIDDRYVHLLPDGNIYNDVFFELSGEGSSNYCLDQPSLEKAGGIRGKILPRPINVLFYSVSKEYDGTPFFDKKWLRYCIADTGDKASGIVLGSGEIQHYLDTSIVGVDGDLSDYLNTQFKLNGYELFSEDSLEPPSQSYPVVSINNGNVALSEGPWICRTSFPVVWEGNTFTLQIQEGSEKDTSISLDGDSLKNEYGNYVDARNDTDGSVTKLPFNMQKISGHANRENVIVTIEQKLRKTSYQQNAEASRGDRVVNSDVGKVLVDTDGAYLPSKNVTNELTEMTYENVKLTSGPYGSAESNYSIKTIRGFGRIYPRNCIVHVVGKSKVYDGNRNLELQLSHVERKVGEDDLQLNTDAMLFQWADENVGSTVIRNNSNNYIGCLKGSDYYNYNVTNVVIDNANDIEITPADIQLTFNTLKIIPQKNAVQISYYLHNTLSGDDVNIDLSQAEVGFEDGSVIYNLFSNTNELNSQVITFVPDTCEVELVVNGNRKVLSDTEKVTISNLKLIGKDANNYNLTTKIVQNIPMSVLHSR